jgi:hypothetical protein
MPVSVDRLFGFDAPTQLMTEALWQRLWRLVTGDGVYMESSSSLAVTPNSPPGMSVVVQPGVAWVGGAYAELTSPKTLAIAAAPASGTRIDRVVLRRKNDTNTVELDVVQGMASSSPTPPSLTRTGDVYEVSLARVVVPSGTTAIGASNIVDERPDPQLCGHVTPGAPRGYTSRLVGGIDTITLANGSNNNVALPNATIVRITGPTGAFAITGLAGGEAGRVVILVNNTSSPMSIHHESTASAAANRIVTPTGYHVTAQTVLLTYDGTAQRWRVLDVAVKAAAGPGQVSMQVSLPTTVGNYAEIMAVPPDTAVRLAVNVPALGITKIYQLQALNSTFSGVWDVPPASMSAPDVTANDVVLEMVWDNTNNVAVLRLRRRAGTSAATAYIFAEANNTINARSGTGTSTQDNPLWHRAQRGWQLVGRAIPTAAVTSVSFQGLRMTQAGALRLLIFAKNALTSGYHLGMRVNGETSDASWTGHAIGVGPSATTGGASASFGYITEVRPSSPFFVVTDIGYAIGLLCAISLSTQNDMGFVGFCRRTSPPAEVNRLDIIAQATNGIAAGSVFELYQLLER